MMFSTGKTGSVLLAAGLFACLLGCAEGPLKTFPDELIGTWTTTDSRYADRFLKFTQVSVIFGTGQETAEAFLVSSVTREFRGDRKRYTVLYHDQEGTAYRMVFQHDAAGGGVIRIEHQEDVEWLKQG